MYCIQQNLEAELDKKNKFGKTLAVGLIGILFDAKNEHRRVAALRCKEDPIYVFSVMKLRGLVPNFHINVL
jgi:hypothetical protein